MRMYAVSQVVLSEKNGAIAAQTIIGPVGDKEIATDLMRKVYEEELKRLGLNDNNAVDENGEAIPGGYFTEDEAGIYDYVDFAFGQLLEVVSLVVGEVEVKLEDKDTAVSEASEATEISDYLIAAEANEKSHIPASIFYINGEDAMNAAVDELVHQGYDLDDIHVFPGDTEI